jgi:type II secretory pathway pseudopilin PulG
MKQKLSLTAFSLVELMGVLAILGLLAAIVLPRITGSDEHSKIAACKTHKCNIEVQTEMWLQNTGSWPATNLSDIGADANYFPQGLPICPVDGSSYTIDSATGRVSGHLH